MKNLVVILCLWSTLTAQASPYDGDPTSVDNAFTVIGTSYPFYRNLWGTFSITTGLYCGVWGFKEFFGASDLLGRVMGFALTFSGWTTFFDGYRLSGDETEIELVNHRYQRYAPGQAKEYGGVVSREEYGRLNLRRLADEAYTGRILRMTSYLIASASLFYFYGVGNSKGSLLLLIPGIIMGGAGVYRLIQDSPEEAAQMSLGRRQASWRILPGVNSIWFAARF
ncbi:MAG: hypothetical protein HYR96_00235 [Deltaproteobacteria bacterium]|nr:hypothetical protein [Deltaproteobacteria bacterium]MBI3293404.1 hypothetical protein [Deltaproteobacteria bacterium]